MDITSPSMEVARGCYRSFTLQTRIVDVQRLGFNMVGQKLSKLKAFERRRNSCFPQASFGVL